MVSRLAIAIAIATLLASAARAQEMVEIPPSQLEGRRLVLKESNCSIEAPGADWRWFLKRDPDPKRHRYVCMIPGNQHASFVLTIDVYERALGPLDEARAREVVDFLKSWLAKTTTPGEFTVEPSAALLGSGAFRYAGTTTTSDGTRKSIFGYIARPHHQYGVSCITLEAKEPPAFTEFARSLRVLGPFEEPATDEGPSAGTIALVVLGVLALLLLSVKGFRKPDASQPT